MSNVLNNKSISFNYHRTIFSRLFLFLFIILAPLSVTAGNRAFLIVIFCSCTLSLFFSVLLREEFKLDPFKKRFIVSYLSVYLVGILSSFVHMNILYGEYVNSVVIGRLFTLTTFFLVLFYALGCVDKLKQASLIFYGKLAFKVLSLFVLLGGGWQLMSFYSSVPFPLETRTWLHGVPDAIAAILPQRLTSFAEEPNFFSPIIIEFLILCRLFVKGSKMRGFLIFCGLTILGMTFSGGAYVNLLLLVLFYICLHLFDSVKKAKLSKFQLFFLLGLTFLVIILLQFGGVLIDYIVAKFSHEASGGSSRSQFLSSLILLWLDGSSWEIIFGRGVATLSVLPLFGMDESDFLFRISNNMFLDLLWETGVFGVALLCTTFFSLFIKGFKNRRNKYFETGMLLTVHLLITSMYRSEYLSMHFLWLIVLIFICYKLGGSQKISTGGIKN